MHAQIPTGLRGLSLALVLNRRSRATQLQTSIFTYSREYGVTGQMVPHPCRSSEIGRLLDSAISPSPFFVCGSNRPLPDFHQPTTRMDNNDARRRLSSANDHLSETQGFPIRHEDCNCNAAHT